MEEKNTPIIPDVSCIPVSIGKTTYLVRVYFSDTSTETMEDKIVRMSKNEIIKTGEKNNADIINRR